MRFERGVVRSLEAFPGLLMTLCEAYKTAFVRI